MPTYKLIGTKPNETPDEAIIRCANNLVKAVLASGRPVEGYPGIGMVGLDVSFYSHMPDKIFVALVSSKWELSGKTPLKVNSVLPEPENSLTQDDACTESDGEQ